MKIKSLIRTYLSSKWILLIKKDKCEICNSDKKLCVHYVKPFAEILQETLDELKLENKDSNDYTKDELNIITNSVLGKHLKYEYMTVCNNCHKELHKNGTYNIGKNYSLYYEKIRIQKSSKEYLLKKDLRKYLNKILNKKLFKEDKNILIEKIDARVKSRQQRSYTKLNEKLKELKLPYVILSKKSNDKRYWMVKRI